jgi:hypothetical protein
MSYKKNANANRDALFGGAASKGPPPKSRSTKPAATQSTAAPTVATASTASRGYQARGATAKPRISEEVKAAKMKEAEDYKKKASKAMERGFFTSPDPVAASTFYKRAADCYQVAQEPRLERLFRVQSGECNMTVQAWASAASDFTRAAELLLESDEDMDVEQLRRDASDMYKKAAEAWTQMGETAKAAETQIKAAFSIVGNTSMNGDTSVVISKDALTALEEAVEAFVPDLFNPYARYRQTGRSAFITDDETVETSSPQSIQLAESHIATRSYSHEPLQQVVHILVQQGEYPSALYAAGAASTLLERDGVSTLSLGRAYCTETILMLAQGDPVGAEERFLNRHCQSTPYLSSRECKLSEELFRAIKIRDGDALEEARDPAGSNRAALANLHESLRTLVTELRLSGVARKKLPGDEVPSKKKPPKSSSSAKKEKTTKSEALKAPETSLNDLLKQKTGYENDVNEGAVESVDNLQDELDALNFDDDEASLEDDDIDLR